MADRGAAAVGVGAALNLPAFSASTAGVSVSLKIDSAIVAEVTRGVLSLRAYYEANRKPVENAIRKGLERTNESGVVDPKVRKITEGSILVELHCQTEESLIQFTEDIKAEKVKQRLEKEFKNIGYSSELLVTIENAFEVNKKVEMVRLSQEESRTKKVEGRVKNGQPTKDELEKLSGDITTRWNILGRRLNVQDNTIEEIDRNFPKVIEKGYEMLKRWKQQEGCAATYQALSDALQHELLKRKDLAEKYCYASENELQTDQSNRLQGIVGLGQKLETLDETVRNILELVKENPDIKNIVTRLQQIETSVKQLKEMQKSVKNSMTGNEEEENELAADITPNAPVSLDRQDNARFVEKGIQSESEGNTICSKCQAALEKERDGKEEIGQLKSKRKTNPKKEGKNRTTKSQGPIKKEGTETGSERWVYYTYFPDKENEFSSSTGVLSNLIKNKSDKPSASRSGSGPGSPHDIFSENAAKECGTSETVDSWWCVDLGKKHRLVVTHYALRHGRKNGTALLTQWKFQGSNDDENWTDIKYFPEAKHFSSLEKYSIGRWTVKGGVGAFRYFRILQTQKNSDVKYGIYLSGMELYGTLAKLCP